MSNLDEARQTAPERTDRSLIADLGAIMVRPRRTMRAIIDSDPDQSIKTLLFLAILSAVLDDFNLEGFDEATGILDPLVMTGVVVGGILIGLTFMALAYYVLSAAATFTGRWFGGSGGFHEVRAAITWGLAPIVWALLYRIPALMIALTIGSSGPPRVLISGGQIEMSGGSLSSLGIWITIALFALDLIVIGWYFVVASNTVGEAHRFSAWKGLATLLTAFVLPFVSIALLVFVTTVYLSKIG